MISTIKLALLGGISTILALPFRVLNPINNTIRRVFFLTIAKITLPELQSSIQLDGKLLVKGSGNIQVGEKSRIGQHVEMGTEASGQIILGAEVRINRGTTLVAYDSIEIGNQTLIGEFVSIRDANHGISPNQPVREQAHEASAIKIGRDVWIGRGSVILPGVEIGDHSIIGANSVVSKSIPPGSIAVGSPAKPIRKR